MPLLEELPNDVINRIIWYLSNKLIDLSSKIPNKHHDKFPEFTYELNHFIPLYEDILSLSSTCVYFRKILGPVLFSDLSILRDNQMDTVLKYERPFFYDEWFNYANLITFTLRRNFELCKMSVEDAGSSNPNISRYQQEFSMNNYVTYLEVNRYLMNQIDLFPNVKYLKVLDNYVDPNSPISGLKIEMLAINVIHLMKNGLLASLLPSLKRLDLFMDLSIELKRSYGLMFDNLIKQLEVHNQISQLNVFLAHYLYLYTERILKLISTICETSQLQKFSLRTQKFSYESLPSEAHDLWWDKSSINSTNMFKSLFRCNNLNQITVDESVFRRFSDDFINGFRKTPIIFTLVVDRGFPINFEQHKTSLRKVIRNLSVTHLNVQYINDFGLNLLDVVEQWLESPLTTVTIEEAWRDEDDEIIKKLLERVPYCCVPGQNLKDFKPWTRVPENSPSYRIPKTYTVNGQRLLQMDQADTSITNTFWSVETSLLELSTRFVNR